jgi:hypothetical protein
MFHVICRAEANTLLKDVLKQQHNWRNELQEQCVLTGIPNMRPYVKTLPHVVRGQQQAITAAAASFVSCSAWTAAVSAAVAPYVVHRQQQPLQQQQQQWSNARQPLCAELCVMTSHGSSMRPARRCQPLVYLERST